MENVLYIVEKINCRGDVWEEKSKVDRLKAIRLFKYLLKENEEDREDLIDVIEDLELSAFLHAIFNTSFTACDDEERDEQLNSRMMMLERGKGYIEMEESFIGFGRTPKDAIIEVAQIDEDWS